MSRVFDSDPYPGKPRVLFVGSGTSTHSYSWIDLLADSELNVRLFALPDGVPPKEWRTKTYVTFQAPEIFDTETRRRMYPFPFVFAKASRFWNMVAGQYGLPQINRTEKRLAAAIRAWKPDVIHTLGFDPASYLYLQARDEFRLRGIGTWVAQARGGPDFVLNQYVPEKLGKIRRILAECDQFIADNQPNYDFALKNGLDPSRLSGVGVVPGTGGLDLARLREMWAGLPSQRPRIIVCPKTYEAPSSKALPILEAIRLAWDKIKPCQIHFLWVVQPEVQIWYQTLPQEIRDCCHLYDRIPRGMVLELMAKARVMLAPSLTDGTPNSMLEAMALGALPVVSPLDTITPLVRDGINVLFARNLYPNELAEALERAMTDDRLVDTAAESNLEIVQRIANRERISGQVIQNYFQIANRDQ